MIALERSIDQWATQARKGTLQLCLMALLKGRELYGYEIAEYVERYSEGELAVTEGTIYPLLHRMENDGVVKSHWKESTGGPPRRYYALTIKGEDLLKRILGEWKRYTEACQRITERGMKGE